MEKSRRYNKNEEVAKVAPLPVWFHVLVAATVLSLAFVLAYKHGLFQ